MIGTGSLLRVGAGLALAGALLGLVMVALGWQDRVAVVFDALFVTSLAFILASLVVGLRP